ncbi:MAG TPA: NAD(P)-binding domain-containing protein [Kofleriaceae bacterium]
MVSAARLVSSGRLAIQPGAGVPPHAKSANVTTAAQVRVDIDATQSRMHIAIIGSGHIGGGLGRAWANKGHSITFGVRDTSDPDLKPLLDETRAKAASIGEAARAAEVVALAMPYGALDAVLDAVGDLAGKVVIDCTNAVVPGMKLKYGFTTSSAEELQKRIPKARVVKSFNAQGAENLANPIYDGVQASNFFCGDDAAARATVKQLVADVGFEPIDVGPLESARLVEPLMMLWMMSSKALGTRDVAFKVLKR